MIDTAKTTLLSPYQTFTALMGATLVEPAAAGEGGLTICLQQGGVGRHYTTDKPLYVASHGTVCSTFHPMSDSPMSDSPMADNRPMADILMFDPKLLSSWLAGVAYG